MVFAFDIFPLFHTVHTQLLNLVLLQPLLDELFLALSQHGPAQLQCLMLVQLAALQQDPEILQQRGGLPGRGGHLLESQDGFRRPEYTLHGERKGGD